MSNRHVERPLSRDIHHDPWLAPQSDELWQVSREVFDFMEAAPSPKNRQRRDAAKRRLMMVENLIANFALITAYHPLETRLAINARRSVLTRYDRQQFPRRTFSEIADGLEALGLVERQRGARGGKRTTLEPTSRLRHMLPQCGEEAGIERIPGAETIILKASQGRRRPKVLIDYEDTPETRHMRHQMEGMNEALGRANITFAGQRQPPIHLTRRFQIEHPDLPPSFDQHGRLYGGFWETMPKSQRGKLRIDGAHVADLDFSAMFLRLAYIAVGEDMPDGDPYEGIAGLPRDMAKVAASVLLCKSGHLTQLPPDLEPARVEGWTGRGIESAIGERHAAIAHLFGSGVGLRLMFMESEILLGALDKLTAQGRIGLPMHDGLMVREQDVSACHAAMTSSSIEVTGQAIPVVQKPIFAKGPPMVSTGPL